MAGRTLLHDAVDTLRNLERRKAASLMRQYFDRNPYSGETWKSVARLADQIGEIDLSVEAMRRYATSKPPMLERYLQYWSELAKRGRTDQCLAEISRVDASQRENDAAILHLLGTLAAQRGEFEEAEQLAQRTIEINPMIGQHWLSLAMIKTFRRDDPYLAQMESLRTGYAAVPSAGRVPFLFALGKALHDIGEYDQAFAAIEEGAEIKRVEEAYDGSARETFTDRLISDFVPGNLSRLTPSDCDSDRPIFVMGLPRSGTTLLEQILTSHSAVSGGGELNLFRAALHPAGDFSFNGALRYEARSAAEQNNPWGDVGRDYMSMLDQRFGETGRIVDKTLNHSRFFGLLAHTLPNAPVIWIRRNPDDVALSVYRNFFSSTIRWAWSLSDIGHYFRCEDRLFEHWTRLHGNRILTVEYEKLVADPEPHIKSILDHVGLETEDAVFEPHRQETRAVMTASVAQVREPISSKRVGAAQAYHAHLAPFRSAYYGSAA